MDLKPYVANIKAFVASLPTSDIAFLYFQKSDDKKFVPRINTNAKQWVLHKNNLYIIQSCDGYCYIYKESAIKYKVYLDHGEISGIVQQDSTHGFFSGGSGAIMNDINLGNHLTVGLSKSFITKRILLMTHTTTYIPNSDNPVEYQRECSECNVYLESTLDESCDCITKGRPLGVQLKMYNDEDINIVPIIKEIHRYILKGVAEGGRKSRKNERTVVHIGPKSGKYKLLKGRRIYIGGNNDFRDLSAGGFVPSFSLFVKEIVLDAVASYRYELSEAIVVDDNSDHVMVRYIFKAMGFDTSHVFMIERDMVIHAWRAHIKPVDQRTEVEAKALDTFVDVVDGFRNVIVVA